MSSDELSEKQHYSLDTMMASMRILEGHPELFDCEPVPKPAGSPPFASAANIPSDRGTKDDPVYVTEIAFDQIYDHYWHALLREIFDDPYAGEVRGEPIAGLPKVFFWTHKDISLDAIHQLKSRFAKWAPTIIATLLIQSSDTATEKDNYIKAGLDACELRQIALDWCDTWGIELPAKQIARAVHQTHKGYRNLDDIQGPLPPAEEAMGNRLAVRHLEELRRRLSVLELERIAERKANKKDDGTTDQGMIPPGEQAKLLGFEGGRDSVRVLQLTKKVREKAIRLGWPLNVDDRGNKGQFVRRSEWIPIADVFAVIMKATKSNDLAVKTFSQAGDAKAGEASFFCDDCGDTFRSSEKSPKCPKCGRRDMIKLTPRRA